MFSLSTSKTVRVQGIHVRHWTGPCDVWRTATVEETRPHAMHGARHGGVNKTVQLTTMPKRPKID